MQPLRPPPRALRLRDGHSSDDFLCRLEKAEKMPTSIMLPLITIQTVSPSSSSSAKGDSTDRSLATPPDGPAAQELQSASCVDRGDGVYQLRWISALPGAFTVYAKIDGLHVIGSPARLLFVKAEPKAAPASAKS